MACGYKTNAPVKVSAHEKPPASYNNEKLIQSKMSLNYMSTESGTIRKGSQRCRNICESRDVNEETGHMKAVNTVGKKINVKNWPDVWLRGCFLVLYT